MKRFVQTAGVVILVLLAVACGNSPSKNSDNSVDSSESTQKRSSKIECPRNSESESADLEAVALAKVCFVGILNSSQVELTKVVVAEENKANRTAKVDVFANRYGCKFCPEEQVFKLDLVINIRGLWQVSRHSGGFIDTPETVAVRVQKQTDLDEQALQDSKITFLGEPKGSGNRWSLDIQGDYPNVVWVYVRLQFPTGENYEFGQSSFGHYQQGSKGPVGEYELEPLKGQEIPYEVYNQAQPRVIAYKLVTFQNGYPSGEIDAQTDWIPWDGK